MRQHMFVSKQLSNRLINVFIDLNTFGEIQAEIRSQTCIEESNFRQKIFFASIRTQSNVLQFFFSFSQIDFLCLLAICVVQTMTFSNWYCIVSGEYNLGRWIECILLYLISNQKAFVLFRASKKNISILVLDQSPTFWNYPYSTSYFF